MLRTVFLFYVVLPSIFASRLVCYYASWAVFYSGTGYYPPDQIDPKLCTHLVYAFAVLNEATYEINVGNTNSDISLQGYSNFVALKTKNLCLKTMISIGGAADSTDGTGKYSKLVTSSANIATFVNSVVAFLQKYSFDGLDFDWQYPSTPSEKSGFVELMTSLRNAFSSQGFLLSAASLANENVANNGYDLPSLSQSLDFLNLMAYDMHGTWESTADHLAPLYQRSWDTDPTNNIDTVVSYYISNGLTASKINLGIPLYGNAWSLSSSVVTPPAPASGAAEPGPIIQTSGVLSYSEICYYVLNSGWSVVQNSQGLMGPYAYSSSSPIQWVGYDDPAFAIVKGNYAISRGLGGAMVWDISKDDFGNRCGTGNNPMLTAIAQVVLWNNPSSRTAGSLMHGNEL